MEKTFWYRGVDYNMVRVVEKLADIVIDKGGRVEDRSEGVKIRTRGFSEKIEKAEDMVRFYEVHAKDHNIPQAKYDEGIAKAKKEVEDLKAAEEAAPIINSRFVSKYGLSTGSLYFVLDGTMYRFSFADNPFFPDTYSKIRLNKNGEYYGQYYGMNLTTEDEIKEYFIDAMWEPCAAEECIAAVAEDIFTRLMDAAPSERYIEKERRQVPNTYNDGWHWETVTKNDNKKHTVDF